MKTYTMKISRPEIKAMTQDSQLSFENKLTLRLMKEANKLGLKGQKLKSFSKEELLFDDGILFTFEVEIK